MVSTLPEVFKALINLFQQVPLLESAVFLIYSATGAAIYFFIKIWYPDMIRIRNEENEQKRMLAEREIKKTEMLEQALNNMQILLQANTDTVGGFNKSIQMLDSTLEKVSDKLFEHDAQSKSLVDGVKNVKEEISHLREISPTIADINLIHQRLDDLKTNIGDKLDVGLINRKLDQILETVANIKGKIM